jgi:hypothetical protein
MSNSNECAYPVLETEIGINFHTGLTKREAFAMAAMQGMLANTDFEKIIEKFGYTVSYHSVSIADALLKELEK